MSSLSLITGPTADPVTLAEAKAQCRVDSAEEEGLLVGYLLAARHYCEDYTGRVFATQTWEMKLDGGWPTVFDRPTVARRNRIVLPNPPAQSVTSITYVDTSGALQTLASNQYSFSKGDIFGFVEQAYGVSWPAVRCQLETITVRFIAGYGANPSDLPEPIRQAILLLTSHFNENREAVIADTRAVAIELPLSVMALLQNYMTEGWV
jgi:uncharacterized phiE125 gp8 family phage protein